MPNRPRPQIEAMVAEAAARKRAVERGDDPEQCAEVLAARQKMTTRAFLAQRIDGGGGTGLPPGFGPTSGRGR